MYSIQHHSTNFPKGYKPPLNLMCQKGDMKQVPYQGLTNNWCHFTKFSFLGDLDPSICAPCKKVCTHCHDYLYHHFHNIFFHRSHNKYCQYSRSHCSTSTFSILYSKIWSGSFQRLSETGNATLGSGCHCSGTWWLHYWWAEHLCIKHFITQLVHNIYHVDTIKSIKYLKVLQHVSDHCIYTVYIQ